MALIPMPVHRSLTRPLLMQGAEVQPMWGLIMTSLFFIFIIRSFIVAAFGIIFFFVGRALLRRMATSVDHAAAGILLKHYKYKKFYKAHPTHWGLISAPKKID